MKVLYVFLLTVLLVSGRCFAQQKANYKLAEKFAQVDFSGIAAKNSLQVVPHFIAESENFWFEFRTDDGVKFYLVEPEKGK